MHYGGVPEREETEEKGKKTIFEKIIAKTSPS